MQKPNRIIPNAYELFLLRCILRIEGQRTGVRLKQKDYKYIAEKFKPEDGNFSVTTVRKFFGTQHHNRRVNFNPESINIILRKIRYDRKWKTFQKFVNPKDEIDPDELIPIAHFEQLSSEWKKIIIRAVRSALRKIFKDVDLRSFTLEKIDSISTDFIPEKLEKYLNTTWYAYFHFPYGDPYPQLIRTIVKIGNSPNEVETNSPTEHHKLNNFHGSVRLDKNRTTLIFDMVASGTGERALHIKVLIHTSEEIPEIVIGEYSNIGLGAIGVYSIKTVFQYLDGDLVDLEKATPRLLDPRDKEFSELPLSLINYLADYSENCIMTTTKTILSYSDLEDFIKEKKFDKYINRRRQVRLSKNLQVILSAPRYDIKEDVFLNYKEGLLKIKELIEADFPFEVNDYYFSKNKINLKLPLPYDFYSDRVSGCQILIVFLFHDDTDESLAELFWAIDQGKTVHIFTTPNLLYLPKLVYNPPSHVRIHNHFSTFNEVVEYFQLGAESLFQNELTYFHEA